MVILRLADGCCVACTGVDGNDSELDEEDEAFRFLVDALDTFDGNRERVGVVVVLVCVAAIEADAEEDEEGVADVVGFACGDDESWEVCVLSCCFK